MLGLSQHLFADQHFDLVMTSGNVSFQQRRSSELGGVGRERRGTVREKKKRKAQDEEQWKGRCSKVPVVSQLRVHVLITDIAWGEGWTNTGSWARWGLLIMRFQLTFNPKPLWAVRLLLLTPHWWRPPEEFILDSHNNAHKEILAENRIAEYCFLCLSVPGQANELEQLIQNSPAVNEYV